MRVVYLILLIVTFSYAKKDFYYGFVDSSGEQISQQRIQAIDDGFETIKNARDFSKEGRLDEAYEQINALKEQNKIPILYSDIIILYSEIAIKKKSKRLILEASKELEKAINDSRIHESDLARAYMILVELKLNINKSDEAKYFANIIINNFDNEVVNAYGKIYLAKVYKYKKNYDQSIKILYEVLTKTTDLLVATLVADELFDVYVLNEQKEKAYELISQVLKKNMDYYASDSFLALEKVNRLLKAQMPEFAVQILHELLNRTDKPAALEDFKYKLAEIYMKMYDGTDKYLTKARELYKDIINDYPSGIYSEKSKMYIDEILMRQGVLEPAAVAAKYADSESMQQKVLVQELLNHKKQKKYDLILKSKRIYKKISDSIAQRFGYESIEKIFDEVAISMIKQYLNTGKCFLLNEALQDARNETFQKLVEDKETKDKFFECLIDVPFEKAYVLLKDTFNTSRNANIYLYLERMAISLQNYTDAKSFSAKIDMVDDKEILAKEFLYRFLILNHNGDSITMDKFFNYAQTNQEFIKFNEDKPMIIDFYYYYYLYLIKKDYREQANEILNRLYEKQKENNAHIYSPFVELELAKIAQTNNQNEKALSLLLDSLEYSRKIRPNALAQVYYEIAVLYEQFNNNIKKDEFVNKCKAIENTENSLYKKMCDEM
ncbi:hypothetical protein CP965_12000 [Halarcobacter mediterraneus]|uniref:Uncharacterized protein n=1 Tax=Halarcobacter mediterraneus TaxID=2023153 RepID=A0A4Q1ATU2_9BACT|nr:hypothetical protein [Halarcobacter mediterraneus]RXK11897.1 hypothetical protein CP965_12000 [Halarcobacter mediterraneus]